jgi:hypothetical protein
MAGAASETVLLGDHDEVGIRVDARRVRQRLRRWYGSDDADLLWNYTVDLVARHSPAIERLALRLERERVLDGPTIDDVVARG